MFNRFMRDGMGGGAPWRGRAGMPAGLPGAGPRMAVDTFGVGRPMPVPMKSGGAVPDPASPTMTFGLRPTYVPYLGNYYTYGETGPEHQFFGPTGAGGGAGGTDTDGDGIPDDQDDDADGGGQDGGGGGTGGVTGRGGVGDRGDPLNRRSAAEVAAEMARRNTAVSPSITDAVTMAAGIDNPLMSALGMAAGSLFGMHTPFDQQATLSPDALARARQAAIAAAGPLGVWGANSAAAFNSRLAAERAVALSPTTGPTSRPSLNTGGGQGGDRGGGTAFGSADRAAENAAKGKGGSAYAQGGAVSGGQADDVPAMLSHDEHVIPSDVVAALGDGSSDAGHRKLKELVARVRKHSGRPNTLPPKSLGLSQYMRGK